MNLRTPPKSRSPSSALLPLFLGEGSPTKIDYRKKGTLILTSLLEGLVNSLKSSVVHCCLLLQALVFFLRLRIGPLISLAVSFAQFLRRI